MGDLVLDINNAQPAAPSSKHAFTITELKRDGDGSFVETGVKFVWDARSQSAPRDFWEYAVKQRSAREDYPGADEPTEQVLGPNFEPFTLHGCWDDRYAGLGFAENMRTEMEKLTQRGNLCRMTLDAISITGLITGLKVTYKRSFYQHYEFTVSPHFRVSGGDVRKQNDVAPQSVSHPADYSAQVRSLADQLVAALQAAPVPYITGTTYNDVVTQVNTILDKLDTADAVIDTRVFSPAELPVNSILRVTQAFDSMRAEATTMVAQFATKRTDTDLFYEDAVPNLNFDVWTRDMSTIGRQIIATAKAAYEDLSTLVNTNALALYRPYAGESLYDVSNRFYQTPHRWRDIAEANNLFSFVLTGMELLVIPKAV
jgi:hypothetical protein